MLVPPVQIAAYTLSSALGTGNLAHLDALRAMRSGLTPYRTADGALATWVGRIDALDGYRLAEADAPYDCRNNRLAALAMDRDGFRSAVFHAREHHGSHRIGVFLGTSTSGIAHTESCFQQHLVDGLGLGEDLRYDTSHTNYSLGDYCRRSLGLSGPAMVISTACSSAAKAIAAGQRYISAGLCDAAVVGGADTLCATTLYGFRSLDVLSTNPVTPWGLNRDGINIGEGAGFLLLERTEAGDTRPMLLGHGESSDAHHISAPHPDGEGAVLAMNAALASAGLSPSDIDYVNLHGTGTQANDCSEDLAMARVFGKQVSASSTKGATGHTLGAAGAIEAALCLICLEHGLLPGTNNTRELDPALSLEILRETTPRKPRRVLSNSFGFGGSNCSLVLGHR